MNPHGRARKLLIIPVDHDPITPSSITSSSSSSSTTTTIVDLLHGFSSPIPPPDIPSNTSSSSPPSQLLEETHESIDTLNTVGGAAGYSFSSTAYKLNPPFDASMALTVLVLLTAFFFMGFFSMYLRRFSGSDNNNNDEPSSSSSSSSSQFQNLSAPLPRSRRAGKGVDPDTIRSLPVYWYDESEKRMKDDDGGGGGGDPSTDCAICLSEYEGGERVKAIPYCGHFFHAECIDAWLASHVTCPLCRTEKIFPRAREETGTSHGGGCDGSDGARCGGGGGSGSSEPLEREMEVTATVDGSEAWSGGGASRRD